jgi:hypothetical protein
MHKTVTAIRMQAIRRRAGSFSVIVGQGVPQWSAGPPTSTRDPAANRHQGFMLCRTLLGVPEPADPQAIAQQDWTDLHSIPIS